MFAQAALMAFILACDKTCATCLDDYSYNCIECKDGYFKYNQYYDNTGYCYACNSSYGSSHCSQCTSDCTESSRCTFQCTQCEDGYYLKDGKCSSCDSSCKTCDGPTNQNCIECKDGLFLNDNGMCTGCDDTCVSCEGKSTFCTSCKSHFYLTSNGECKECSDSCVECKDANTCTKCPEFQFMHEGKCLKSCLQIGEGWGANDMHHHMFYSYLNCKFKSKDSTNLIKTTNNFNSPPETLKILEEREYEIPSFVSIKKCTFENTNDSSSIYVVEKQILSSEADDNALNENTSSNLFYIKSKSNQYAKKILKQSYNNIIEFEFNNYNRKESKIVLSFSSKCLIGFSSLGLVALIILIITKNKSQNTTENEENNGSIDSLKE